MVKVTIEIDASNMTPETERDDLHRTIKTTEVHTFSIQDASGMKELEALNLIRKALEDVRL